MSAATPRSRSTRFDAVLFDFGGVLADGPFDAFTRYEEEKGLPAGFVRNLNATDHETNAWAQLERGEVGIDEFCDLFEAEAQRAGGKVDARVLISSIQGSRRPAMIEAVRRCHEHFQTALLTNNFVRVRGTDAHLWLDELFDVVVESAVEGIRKPDPAFYRLACDLLGVGPSKCVFLDDLGVNLRPAREMGMTTIKVTEPADAIEELQVLLDLDLSDLFAEPGG